VKSRFVPAVCLMLGAAALPLAAAEAPLDARVASVQRAEEGVQALVFQLVLAPREDAQMREVLLPLPPGAKVRRANEAALRSALGLHEHLYALARTQWSRRSTFGWEGSRAYEPEPKHFPERAVAELAGWEFVPWSLDEPPPEGWRLLRVSARTQHAPDMEVLLPPLVATFPATGTLLPMWARQFDITVLTDRPVVAEDVQDAMLALNARVRGYVHLTNLWSVQPLPRELADVCGEPFDDADSPPWLANRRWYANRLESAAQPRELPALVTLRVGTARDELPGFWYYGDDDIHFAERFFREHILATILAISVTGFLLLVWVGRRNRGYAPRKRS
jgi:hypothetical protein